MTVYCIAVTFAFAFVSGFITAWVLPRSIKKTKEKNTQQMSANAEIINFLSYNGEQQQ